MEVAQFDYELPPGATKLTLHRQSGDHCKSAPVLEIAVDVQADKGTWVLIGTPDGKKVDALTLPFGTP